MQDLTIFQIRSAHNKSPILSKSSPSTTFESQVNGCVTSCVLRKTFTAFQQNLSITGPSIC